MLQTSLRNEMQNFKGFPLRYQARFAEDNLQRAQRRYTQGKHIGKAGSLRRCTKDQSGIDNLRI